MDAPLAFILPSLRPRGRWSGLPRRRCVRTAERWNVRWIDLVAVDRVIADLQLFVGEPQGHEDPNDLQQDERCDTAEDDHPRGSLGLPAQQRSEEHTSELQSLRHLV